MTKRPYSFVLCRVHRLKSADLDNLPQVKKVEFILPTLIIIYFERTSSTILIFNLCLPAFVGFCRIQGQESQHVCEYLYIRSRHLPNWYGLCSNNVPQWILVIEEKTDKWFCNGIQIFFFKF